MKRLLMLFMLLSSTVQANGIATWDRVILSGGLHIMMGFAPPELKEADILNIFIEGDGQPGIALKMAQDVGGDTVYIARPCQYLPTGRFNACTREVWSSHRYSQDVVDSMDLAITAMKKRFNASQVRLVGYSGGGAVASIIASKRSDVALLLTVAGNMDHKQWSDYNGSEPLTGSLNPIDFSLALQSVPQIHLMGELDDIVPGSVLMSYLSKLTMREQVKSYIISGADHTCCWSVAVATLLSR